MLHMHSKEYAEGPYEYLHALHKSIQSTTEILYLYKRTDKLSQPLTAAQSE